MQRWRPFRMIVATLVLSIGGFGCHQFTDGDAATLRRYGGRYLPSGEGPGLRWTPVGDIIFESKNRTCNDDDFATVMPTLKHFDPLRLHLIGRHDISDRSVELINRLASLEFLDV